LLKNTILPELHFVGLLYLVYYERDVLPSQGQADS